MDLNLHVLQQAEFAQAKMTAIENYRKMLYDNEMKHQAEMNKLQVRFLVGLFNVVDVILLLSAENCFIMIFQFQKSYQNIFSGIPPPFLKMFALKFLNV